MPGHPVTFAYSRVRACCACSRCGTGGLYIFFFFSSKGLLGQQLNKARDVDLRLKQSFISYSVCGNDESILFSRARSVNLIKWAAPSEFVTYRLCEQRRFRRACASAQSRQNLRCSLIQAVNQEEPSDRKPDPWPLWMAGHAQLKFVMTECSKTQIRLTGLKYQWNI